MVYINDLPRSLTSLKVILFADYTTLFTSGMDIQQLSIMISDDQREVKNWFIANCLTLYADKTYYMIFSSRNIPENTHITLGTAILERNHKGNF